MVVDDSNIIRRKIERSHNAKQFTLVATASNGKEAVENFKDHRPDVLTMDLTMPEMDGIECISKITAIDPDVKILVVSALSDKATGIEALQRGAQGFLCKPFTDEELSFALSELIEE
jgi:two-component system chemotaxis response regulator CheY